jgi:very-short-patch-repair endonuclease
MDDRLGPIFDLAGRQHGVVARWQMTRFLSKLELDVATRQWTRVTRGVYAVGELDDLSFFMAAALAYGPKAVISHLSALMVIGLRPLKPGDIHVSVPHTGVRRERTGIEVHRRRALAWGHSGVIPVTDPTQSLVDANLERYELYRALEEAEARNLPVDLPFGDVVRLKHRVQGRTRSDAEAQFLMLCHDHGLPLPLVNQPLHGVEADFHWPQAKLVVEVDGWDFHKERPQFEEDRRRGLVHSAAGFQVIRASATQVFHESDLVMRAVRQPLTRVRGWRRATVRSGPGRG